MLNIVNTVLESDLAYVLKNYAKIAKHGGACLYTQHFGCQGVQD
jgi:hypothetical protein